MFSNSGFFNLKYTDKHYGLGYLNFKRCYCKMPCPEKIHGIIVWRIKPPADKIPSKKLLGG